jgi:cytochrome c1
MRIVTALALLLCTAGCSRADVSEAQILTGGDVRRGAEAIGRYGCGGCHEIPGIRRAGGTVGPPLTRVARRAYLGGQVPNSPAGMVQWIQHPQTIEPGSAMPDLRVTDQDARDIAAYLYTLK